MNLIQKLLQRFLVWIKPSTQTHPNDDAHSGVSRYVYVAQADDELGGGFVLNPPTICKRFYAVLQTERAIKDPSAADFHGLWISTYGQYPQTNIELGTSGPRIPGTKVVLPCDVPLHLAARDRPERDGTIILEDGKALMVLEVYQRLTLNWGRLLYGDGEVIAGEDWKADTNEDRFTLRCVAMVDVIEAMQRAGEPVPANWEAALKLEDWA